MLDLTRPPPDCPASATRRIELHSRITVDPKTGYSPELKARVEAEIARGKTFEPLAATDGDDAIPPRPELDPLDALEHDQPSIDLVLPGLAAGSVGSIISPGGAGKSILALELSLLITTGFDLSGFAAGGTYKRGAVGIAAAEDPVPAIAQRLRSIGRDHLTPEQRQVFGRAITIEPLAGMHQRLCGWIDPGKSGRVELDTLCGYVWPEEASPDALRKRRQIARRALDELATVGWTLDEYARGKWEISRPKLG